MKRKTSLLIFYLATTTFASSLAFAEDKPLAEEEEPLVPEEFISKPILNEIELGIGYVSDDAYKFGRYNGLQTKGAFLVADIKAREFEEDDPCPDGAKDGDKEKSDGFARGDASSAGLDQGPDAVEEDEVEYAGHDQE